MNNFDFVAPFYDTLAALVFGGSIRNTQTLYLPDIPSEANVLIVGGGTGWLLSELLAINPGCRVWYIDTSARMIELSKHNVGRCHDRVVFIHGNEKSIPREIKFSAVITHFYLDLFSPADCQQVIREIRSALTQDGIWLAADFVNTTWWHHAMLKVMYLFFRIITGIQTNALPDWADLIEKNGLIKTKSQRFYRGFMQAIVFKPAHP